jgi:hypothetical protein
MEFPRDPLGGVVNFVGYNEGVSREAACELVLGMGAHLGIDVTILPSETPEDRMMIDMLSGVTSDEQLWLELLPPDEPPRQWFTDMPEDPIVFLARHTPDVPVPPVGPELAEFAERLETLHETVRTFRSN